MNAVVIHHAGFPPASGGRRLPALGSGDRRAFTLIELLVVIAIIAVLATLVTGLTVGAKDRRVRSRIKTELAEIALAIEQYKKVHGVYPPDNTNTNDPPPNWLLRYSAVSSLYHELSTSNTIPSPVFPQPDYDFVTNAFRVAGFVNAVDLPTSKNFVRRLKPSRHALVDHDDNPATPGLLMFVVPVDGDRMAPGTDGQGKAGRFNVIHYSSTDPLHNVETFDLWVEVIINGQPVEIGNWKE
jgi:prepilin-type N-terminal cleavage/methylation domain-containing protein